MMPFYLSEKRLLSSGRSSRPDGGDLVEEPSRWDRIRVRTGITRCSAWVHLGNMHNYTGIK
jgi:hypothetical protein